MAPLPSWCTGGAVPSRDRSPPDAACIAASDLILAAEPRTMDTHPDSRPLSQPPRAAWAQKEYPSGPTGRTGESGADVPPTGTPGHPTPGPATPSPAGSLVDPDCAPLLVRVVKAPGRVADPVSQPPRHGSTRAGVARSFSRALAGHVPRGAGS